MELEAEVKRLQDELEKTRNEATTAAELGMSLLQANEELRDQMENDSKAYAEQIEALQQDVHSLTLRLEMKTKTHEAYEEEIRMLKSDMDNSFTQRISLIEQNHTAKVKQLNLHIDELKNELTLREDQLERCRGVVGEKEEEICRLREAASQQANSSLLVGELSELQQSNLQLRQRCDSLTEEMDREATAAQEASEESAILCSRVSELEQLLQDKERLSHEWYQSLKETQEEVVLLRGQLETHRVKGLQEDWQGRGNSLFGEVEERRLQTERDLIKFKVQYQSLERAHQLMKQSYKKLKAEFAALLCRHSSMSADADHVERLQRTLSQRNSELEELNEKLNSMEKQKSLSIASHEYANAFVEFGDKKEYIQYLEHEHKETQEQLSSLKRELDLKTNQLIWECKKLSESEAKLHKAERDKARFMNESCKMKLKLQEVLDRHGDGKESIKALEKEVELLKQQLQGRIKTGQTYLDREEQVEQKKGEEKKKQEKEEMKKKPSRMTTINLLEELQKANINSSPMSPDQLVSIPPSKDLRCLVHPSEEEQQPQKEREIPVSSCGKEEKENSEQEEVRGTDQTDDPSVDQDNNSEDVKLKPVVHKVIKASDSRAKMEEQCRQQ